MRARNMAEAVIMSVVAGTLVQVVTRHREVSEFLDKHIRKKMPLKLNKDPDDRPPAIVLSMSRSAQHDVNISGYCVIAEVGAVRELSPKEMTSWAEQAASVIEKLNRSGIIQHRPLTLAFACPVAVAFVVGTLLGHGTDYRTLHWTGTGYVPLDLPDMDRFRRAL
ncbi:MAG: hypothetical protein HXY34_10825 [Candidatus Thorarchaeota archaeon]|nr:hypothetical protein [Candidatus Thorarchaeota archaeon]